MQERKEENENQGVELQNLNTAEALVNSSKTEHDKNIENELDAAGWGVLTEEERLKIKKLAEELFQDTGSMGYNQTQIDALCSESNEVSYPVEGPKEGDDKGVAKNAHWVSLRLNADGKVTIFDPSGVLKDEGAMKGLLERVLADLNAGNRFPKESNGQWMAGIKELQKEPKVALEKSTIKLDPLCTAEQSGALCVESRKHKDLDGLKDLATEWGKSGNRKQYVDDLQERQKNNLRSALKNACTKAALTAEVGHLKTVIGESRKGERVNDERPVYKEYQKITSNNHEL